MVTICEPGVHGAEMLGTQGMGVSVPPAAAVAAAVAGKVGDLHRPKGTTFLKGT